MLRAPELIHREGELARPPNCHGGVWDPLICYGDGLRYQSRSSSRVFAVLGTVQSASHSVHHAFLAIAEHTVAEKFICYRQFCLIAHTRSLGVRRGRSLIRRSSGHSDM